jgi:O-antigen ligase
MGLCILVTVCVAGTAFRMKPFPGDWREKLRARVELLSHKAWIPLCLFIQVTALFLSHSRGGIFATVAAILFLTIAISQAPSLGRTRYLGLIALPVLMLLVVFLVSGETILTRLADADQDSGDRLVIFKLTAQAIRDYPLLGTGFGSFTELFPVYRTEAIPTGFVNAAHNDYLENMLELGIPAALALFASLLWLTGLCVRGLRVRRRNALLPCLGVAATALVGVHSLVDFSLQIPAVTALYIFSLGIAVAQSRPTAAADTDASMVTGARMPTRKASAD